VELIATSQKPILSLVVRSTTHNSASLVIDVKCLKKMTGLVPSHFDANNTSSLTSDPKFSLLLSSMAIDAKKLELLEQRLTGPPSQNLSNNANHNAPPPLPTTFPAPTTVPKPDTEPEPLLNISDEESSSKDTQQSNKEQPKKKRKLFTKEEDAKILEGYKLYQADWEKIVTWGILDRSSAQIRDRFRRLMKQQQQQQQPQLQQGQQNSIASASPQPQQPLPPQLPLQSQSPLPTQPQAQQMTGPTISPSISSTAAPSNITATLVPPTIIQPSQVQSSVPQPLPQGSGTIPSSAPSFPQPPSLSTSPSSATAPILSSNNLNLATVTSPSTALFGADGKRKLSQSDEQPTVKQRKLNDGSALTLPNEPLQDYTEQQTPIHNDKKRIDELEAKLYEKDELLKHLELQLQQQKVEEHWKKRAKEELVTVYRQLALYEQTKARERVAQDILRLGQVTLERHGTELVEVWQDGYAFRELKRKLEANENQKNELEKLKKQLTKKKNAFAKDKPEDSPEMQEILEQEEMYKMKIATVKKTEQELLAEKEKLVIEKSLHIREVKRVTDEDHSQFNNFPLLKDRYLLLSLLGKGGFSEVYKAYDTEELRFVACKIHQLNPHWNEIKKQNYIKHACREYNIHKSLIHPRIVQLYDVFEIDANSFCTVLEYCEGGDLDTYLKKNIMLQEREAKLIIIQIFQGLKYLNEQKRPIIHYDLKPGNILFDKDGGVKITDFGLSKIMEEDQESLELTSQGAGTYWYLPPECFEVGTTPKISSKVDVWSAGVIFYQMLYGKKPFGNNLSQQKILADNIILKANTVEFPAKPVVSAEAKRLILQCLCPQQKDRPDVLQIVKDPFLQLSKKDKSMPPPKKASKKTETLPNNTNKPSV